ncbi:hypothetical protein QCN27_20405 [Cereibacter sp. SYSU M97828]|nr:hypothetical protein [Cereibacter flavus]
MTNVSGPGKADLRNRLFQIGQQALEAEGWKVEKATGLGKGSVRRLTRGKESLLVSIRTTQDQYIAFPRTPDDTEWNTLGMVDAVVAVSVDDKENPTTGKVHFLKGDEVRRRFDLGYKARRAANHKLPVGRGMWLPLYLPHAEESTYQVGGGLGLDFPPIAEVSLTDVAGTAPSADVREAAEEAASEPRAPLTITEAKRQLAEAFGVSPDQVKITIEA